MTVLDWIIGVLFRPSSTYEHAKRHLRFGYWWILLSVFTLEVVVALYGPSASGQAMPDTGSTILYAVTFMMILFDIQAIVLLATARTFRWPLSWHESLKMVGLAWSVILLEDIITFYPALSGLPQFVFWFSLPMFLWYILTLTVGIRQCSGFPAWKSLLIAVISSAPWRLVLFWLYWSAHSTL